MKRILIIKFLILLIVFPVFSQTNQEVLKREVTLYNPYKPSLADFKKRSFLPDLNDTAKAKPDFRYNITTLPYSPEYSINPIKAASLSPDPLPKLYKSYINIGFGNYTTPLAELSITNERSKKGAIGFYGRHFSSNGKIKLQNDKKVFAGYMDNDLSLYGKKFFRENFLDGSIDFSQKLRYAYGYDTSIVDYDPGKKEIRNGYNNFNVGLSFASLTLDSTSFSYDFDVNYEYFYNTKNRDQHNIDVAGIMAKKYKGFYVGSGLEVDYYKMSSTISERPKYFISVSPFVKKNSTLWSFKTGLQILLEKNTSSSARLHIYPDAMFSFNIVQSYIRFYGALNGKLEVNEPKKIIEENPFLIRDGTLFTLPNTNHPLIISAGLTGNNGIGGNYVISASYSFINDMLFYSNLIQPEDIINPQYGNLFIPLKDDVELFNLHGEISGTISDKISYKGNANWYDYTLTKYDYPWNKPTWDGQIEMKYNLRNKIIAGADITAFGKRRLITVNADETLQTPIDAPIHININLSAEYRYTKILSFWLKLNNITFNRYYEWAWYPSQRFLFMVGFTYSL
jgi:hypothetical protein